MQINITIPNEWKTQLEEIARQTAVERKTMVTFHDLIRETIRDKYQLKYQLPTLQDDLFADNFFAFVEYIQDNIRLPTYSATFKLYDYQERLFYFIENHHNHHVILSKFRQGGFTTFFSLWSLWKALYRPNKHICYVVKTDREALYASSIVENIVDNKLSSKIDTASNHHCIRFKNGNSLSFLGCQAMCGRVITDLIVDEAAFIPDFYQFYKSVVEKCPRTILCSTFKPETSFVSLLEDAKAAKNKYSVFKTNMTEAPFYSENWEKETRQNIGRNYFCHEFLQREPLWSDL